MLRNNLPVYAGKIATDVVGSIIYFPLWWYSRGLMDFARYILEFLSNRERGLAFLVWIKNIHKPMYGQTDLQGRLISFFMRIVQIIGRGIIMIFWLLFSILIFLAWLLVPVFILYHLLFQLGIMEYRILAF